MSIISNCYENIYKVTFNEYTNSFKESVSDGSEQLSERKYIHLPNNGLLIRESEIDEYIKYGKGFKTLECVGQLCRLKLDKE